MMLNSYPGRWNTNIIQKGSGEGKTEFSLTILNKTEAEWAFNLENTETKLVFPYREYVPRDKWVRLTAVKDQNHQELILYVDGSEIARTSYIQQTTNETAQFSSSISVFGEDNGRLLNASLFRLAIWSRALTPNEIRHLGKTGKAIPYVGGLIVQWHLDAAKQYLVPTPSLEEYRFTIRTLPSEATN